MWSPENLRNEPEILLHPTEKYGILNTDKGAPKGG
jgi:hypothetical protein